jgi:acetolactate synthase II small subunit
MNISLKISLNNKEGALVRILGTIERRGHRILGLGSRVSNPGEDIQELFVEINCGERSPNVLVRQLERLHDVNSVSPHIWADVLADRQHSKFQATLPSSSGPVGSVRRTPHE